MDKFFISLNMIKVQTLNLWLLIFFSLHIHGIQSELEVRGTFKYFVS